MFSIKTKTTIKDIKVLIKVPELKNMKDAFIRTKDKAEETQQFTHDTPSDYATDNAIRGAENSVYETGHQVKKQTGRILDKVKDARSAKKQMP